MDWQQTIFQKAWRWLRDFKPGPRNVLAGEAVSLAEIHGRLTLFARLLTGEAIELLRAEQEGGWAGHFYYLPETFRLGETQEENIAFYLFRICYLTVQRDLGLNWPAGGNYTLEASRLQARGSSEQVLEVLFQAFPGSQEIYICLQQRIAERSLFAHEIWLPWGHWLASPEATTGLVSSPQATSEAGQASEPETILEAPAREQVDILIEDREAIRNYTLQHYFEKVETIEEFQGTWRETDGGDDLSEHAEALQELDLRQVVRSDEPVHSVFQSEFLPGASAPESRDKVAEGYFVSYDEWDGKKKAYKRDWCRVYPTNARATDAIYVRNTLASQRATLQALRQRFAMLCNQLEQVRRQISGDELDLDVMIDNYADLRAGCQPDERVFLSRRKQRREHSILLLMDLSLSSDGYTGGQRVLDVEKQAVILFAELLSEYGDRFQIDGFSSRTRHHCDYVTFKKFDQPWLKSAATVGAAEPAGYTRIGPALRHATAQLRKENARSRWIILLSDGKPNDYDRYEGQYGIADVRQAIKEARRDGIQLYGLAVEAAAKYYLPQMLGQGSYRILPTPHHLPEALAEFYGRLIKA